MHALNCVRFYILGREHKVEIFKLEVRQSKIKFASHLKIKVGPVNSEVCSSRVTTVKGCHG